MTYEWRVELADSTRTGYRLWCTVAYQSMAENIARRECRSGVTAPLWRVVGPDRRVTWAGSHGALVEAYGQPEK